MPVKDRDKFVDHANERPRDLENAQSHKSGLKLDEECKGLKPADKLLPEADDLAYEQLEDEEEDE